MSKKYSRHIKILEVGIMYDYILNYRKKCHNNNNNILFLDVGGIKRVKNTDDFKYHILNIDNSIKNDNLIIADICNCPQILENTYDIVFSNNVFEHLSNPWLAAKECIRITKKGGLNIHNTVFSWRYHPVPIDCFRYTHYGLKVLFEQTNEIKELCSGYDITYRRKNDRGGKVKNNLDVPPIDKLGGWRENWSVIYIGEKL